MSTKAQMIKSETPRKFAVRHPEPLQTLRPPPAAVYRKFGICRICFRNLASRGPDSGCQEGQLVTLRNPQAPGSRLSPAAPTLSRNARDCLAGPGALPAAVDGTSPAMMTDPIADMLTRIPERRPDRAPPG